MTDTAQSTRLKIRSLGSGRTHIADVPDQLVQPAEVHGRECRVATPPVATLCGVMLGATTATVAVIVMRDTVQVGCRACVALANRIPA